MGFKEMLSKLNLKKIIKKEMSAKKLPSIHLG